CTNPVELRNPTESALPKPKLTSSSAADSRPSQPTTKLPSLQSTPKSRFSSPQTTVTCSPSHSTATSGSSPLTNFSVYSPEPTQCTEPPTPTAPQKLAPQLAVNPEASSEMSSSMGSRACSTESMASTKPTRKEAYGGKYKSDEKEASTVSWGGGSYGTGKNSFGHGYRVGTLNNMTSNMTAENSTILLNSRLTKVINSSLIGPMQRIISKTQHQQQAIRHSHYQHHQTIQHYHNQPHDIPCNSTHGRSQQLHHHSTHYHQHQQPIHHNHSQQHHVHEYRHTDECGPLGGSPIRTPGPKHYHQVYQRHNDNPLNNDKYHFHFLRNQKTYNHLVRQLQLVRDAQQQHQQQYQPLSTQQLMEKHTNAQYSAIIGQLIHNSDQKDTQRRQQERRLDNGDDSDRANKRNHHE
ncbi:hypothetical protein BGZ47_011509, partial [Haplosporangium gracile]